MMIMKIMRSIYLSAVICSLAVLLSVSCDKEEQPAPTAPDTDQPEAIGSFTIGDETVPIVTAMANDTGANVAEFLFSPFTTDSPLTTYLYFCLSYGLMNREYSVDLLHHNDSSGYALTYEDPIRYYSLSRALKDGTILVQRNGELNYNIRLNVTLIDGTPLKLEYNGPFGLLE